MERVCIKCGILKSDNLFYNSSKDTCKDCYKERAREWRLANPERKRTTDKNYRQRKEVKERENLRQRTYYKEHTEQVKKYMHSKNERNYYNLIIDNSTVRERIKRSIGLPYDIMNQHSELIENWKQQLRIKRLLKLKKNESTKTS